MLPFSAESRQSHLMPILHRRFQVPLSKSLITLFLAFHSCMDILNSCGWSLSFRRWRRHARRHAYFTFVDGEEGSVVTIQYIFFFPFGEVLHGPLKLTSLERRENKICEVANFLFLLLSYNDTDRTMWKNLRRHARSKRKEPRSHLAVSACIFSAVAIVYFLVHSFNQLPVNLRLSQRCRMSRMWPSYRLYEVDSPSGLSAKYRLFLYREADPALPPSEGEPRGRPALFIPGNAGSFGQVRSVASSTHHLHQSGQGGLDSVEIDWWTGETDLIHTRGVRALTNPLP
jgi:hypothetical protein